MKHFRLVMPMRLVAALAICAWISTASDAAARDWGRQNHFPHVVPLISAQGFTLNASEGDSTGGTSPTASTGSMQQTSGTSGTPPTTGTTPPTMTICGQTAGNNVPGNPSLNVFVLKVSHVTYPKLCRSERQEANHLEDMGPSADSSQQARLRYLRGRHDLSERVRSELRIAVTIGRKYFRADGFRLRAEVSDRDGDSRTVSIDQDGSTGLCPWRQRIRPISLDVRLTEVMVAEGDTALQGTLRLRFDRFQGWASAMGSLRLDTCPRLAVVSLVEPCKTHIQCPPWHRCWPGRCRQPCGREDRDDRDDDHHGGGHGGHGGHHNNNQNQNDNDNDNQNGGNTNAGNANTGNTNGSNTNTGNTNTGNTNTSNPSNTNDDNDNATNGNGSNANSANQNDSGSYGNDNDSDDGNGRHRGRRGHDRHGRDRSRHHRDSWHRN